MVWDWVWEGEGTRVVGKALQRMWAVRDGPPRVRKKEKEAGMAFQGG